MNILLQTETDRHRQTDVTERKNDRFHRGLLIARIRLIAVVGWSNRKTWRGLFYFSFRRLSSASFASLVGWPIGLAYSLLSVLFELAWLTDRGQHVAYVML